MTIKTSSSKASATQQSSQPNDQRIDQFESSLGELESLIGKMEQGDLSLDDTVKSFERGMSLYENCKQALDQAQLKVELLLKGAAEIGSRPAGDTASFTRTPFDPQTP
jgi:exodeoxyribonuclease VII small subunit